MSADAGPDLPSDVAEPKENHSEELSSPTGWRHWLALNASTGALLGAILLVGMGTELWSPLMPEYLSQLQAPILLIALYGSGKDLVDAAAFYFGGSLAARFNTRRALLICNALPLLGLAILLAWPSQYAVFVALPFIGIWNSVSGPATLRVVGDSLSDQRRSMAFALQSIQKRLASILAYFVSGGLVVWLGEIHGVQAGLALAVFLVAVSWLIQYRFMQTATVDKDFIPHKPWGLFRRLDPRLKQLLISDVLGRWCDGMPRELLILYCMSLLLPVGVTLAEAPPAALAQASAFYVSVLLVVTNVTSLLIYLPIGHVTSKAGAAQKPFVGLTFVFFALFPLAIVVLGPAWGAWGLILAFVIGGLREIGEPSRKALVTQLAPHELRTQGIALYWAARSVGIMLAPLVGGLIWVFAGPEAMLWSAGIVGIIGAALFYLKFAGSTNHEPEAASGLQPDDPAKSATDCTDKK